MSPHAYRHIDANAYSRGNGPLHPKKDAPLDHTYYIQGDGDTRWFSDPRTIQIEPRFRATCDVCPWTGPWHEGATAGPPAADTDGHRHRTENLGAPGWGHCPQCARRTPDDALCDEHAAAYETHLTDRKDDPWPTKA